MTSFHATKKEINSERLLVLLPWLHHKEPQEQWRHWVVASSIETFRWNLWHYYEGTPAVVPSSLIHIVNITDLQHPDTSRCLEFQATYEEIPHSTDISICDVIMLYTCRHSGQLFHLSTRILQVRTRQSQAALIRLGIIKHKLKENNKRNLSTFNNIR